MPLAVDSFQQAPSTKLEDLTFQPSAGTTLGVELELQILDRDTGELAPGALRILDACRQLGLEGVSGEFLLSMLEVKTGRCTCVAEVRDSLFPLLRSVHNIAGSLGYALAIGGTHPFSRASMNAIFPDARYQRIRRRQGWMAYQEAAFGLHVHVGVPSGEAAIGLINLLVEYLPHLLALSANSPFWQGIDTDYASARARMFRPTAQAGVPPCFADWQGFRRFCEVLHAAGAIEGMKDVYWDIRPRPHLGTVEFRIFDAPATLSELLSLTALTRCLVIDGLRALSEDPQLGRGDPYVFWLAIENRWLATRYGLQAECVRRPHGKARSLAEDAAELVDQLLPIARDANEETFLRELRPGSGFETGADRQRRIFRQTGNWQAVIDDMKSRWVAELPPLAVMDQTGNGNRTSAQIEALQKRQTHAGRQGPSCSGAAT